MNMTHVRYLGIPYVVNGDPPTACDCWTIVRWFCGNELGQDLPRYLYDMETLTDDSHHLIHGEIVNHLGERWHRVEVPQRGDVVIMTMAGLPQHCGVMIDPDNFLHSLPGRDSTIERLSHWHTHVVGCYRWRP